MIRRKGGRMLCVLLAAVVGVAGCTSDAHENRGGATTAETAASSSAAPSPATPSASAAAEAPGAAPNDIDTKALPSSFPRLLDETGTQTYLETMVRIHVGFTKNRQAHEVMPRILAVTGGAECRLVPNQTGPAQVVGDNAGSRSGPSPEIAPCLKSGKLVILYAPHKFYQLTRNNNAGFVEDVLRNLVRDYLALLTQHRLNDLDRLATACAAGRMIGGLRDHQYISVQKANSLELSGPPTTDWDKIYVAARDTGNCPRRWLGWV